MNDQPRLSIIPGWCSFDPRMKGKDLQVLCVLGNNASTKSGWCRRSQVTMAKQLGCARSTVQASLDRLIEIGAVERMEVASKSGRDSAYFYRVIYDREPPGGYAFDAWQGDEDEENILLDAEESDTPPAGIPAPPAGPESAPPAGPGSAPINASRLTPAAERTEREHGREREMGHETHDDARSLLKRVKAMEIGKAGNPWPGSIGSSTDWNLRQFAKLPEDERLVAEERRDDYLAICKAQGVKPVALGVYFRDRKFFDVTVQAARAASQKLDRVAVKPFGPVWAGMRAYEFAKGPERIELPGDIRGESESTHAALRKFSEQRAQSYRERKGLGLSADGALIFPDDFERAEYRRRQTDEGYPLVNHLHKLAQERGAELVDGRNQALGDLCEAVPVGSELYERWRAWHVDRGLPLWPDPGLMKVVYFPKGGPEGVAEFMEAAKAAMADGGRDAHAA
jgi:hypothetical protein